MSKLTKKQIEDIIKLYKEGVVVNDIISSLNLDINRRTIYVTLQNNGVSSNRKRIVGYKDSEKKECTKCLIIKPLTDFYKSKISSDGYKTKCKECKKIDAKEYHERPEIKGRNKKRYQQNKEKIRERTKKHYCTLNGQYHQYKKRAKKSSLVFELSEEDCMLFFKTNCYYCGDTISGIGIDRVDNNIGYVHNNCVPCCGECNYMKRTQTQEEFYKRIDKIFNNVVAKLN